MDKIPASQIDWGTGDIPLYALDFTGIEGELFDRLVTLLGRLATLNSVDIATLVSGVYNTQTGTTYTVTGTDTFITLNRAGTVTLTLPDPSLAPGRPLFVRTITANTVVSASSNVVPLAGGAAGTAILAATAGKWAMLVSDGTSWQIHAAN